jgi:hypothetical protein
MSVLGGGQWKGALLSSYWRGHGIITHGAKCCSLQAQAGLGPAPALAGSLLPGALRSAVHLCHVQQAGWMRHMWQVKAMIVLFIIIIIIVH